MSMLDQGSTPQGYMTPEQIQQMFNYSSALTKGGMRDDTITSPWQGARMMADALAGRSMRNQAGGQQMGGVQNYTHRLEQAPNPPPPGPSMTPGSPPQMQAPPPHQPITPTPPVRPPPQMSASPPIPGLGGSVPSPMPGGVPGGPAGMVGGMQPPQSPMGGQPDPMMQALMSPPPGMGMA